MEALQQGAGVGGVTAHGRVRPGGVDIAVEAQVELDQPGDVLDGLLVEAQGPQPLGRHPGADVVVAVEGDGAVGQEAAGGGLADVVEDGGQAQHQVGAGDGPVGPGLQVDGLVQDGQGVLVDVLVALVLVDGLAQGAQLGQDDVGHAGVDHELQSAPGPGADEQALELGAHALGGDDLQAGGHLLHGGHDVHLDVEAELGGEAGGPHDAQGVVVEGLLGADGGAQDAGAQVGQAAAGVDELEVGQAQRHGVDGEVAAGEVPGEGVAIGHLGLARADLVGLGAVGGDLHDGGALARADGAEGPAHVPGGLAPGGQDLLGLLGAGRGGQVQVVGGDAEEGVPHRPADQGDLVPGAHEGVPQGRQGGGQALERLTGLGRQAAVLGGFRGVGGVSGSGVRSHRPKPAMNPHRCAVVLGLSRPVVRTIPHRATIGHRRPQRPSADGAVVCDDVLGQRRPAARTP